MLVIKGLKAGFYKLKFYSSAQEVSITVVEGNYWKNSSLLATKNNVYEV